MKSKRDLRAPLLAGIFVISVVGLILAGFPLRSGASEVQNRLENVPVYPGVTELTTNEYRDGETWVSRTINYQINAEADKVLSFYATYLDAEGWNLENSAIPDSQVLYYGWNKDIGLPAYGFVVGVEQSSNGTSAVTVTQTKIRPH